MKKPSLAEALGGMGPKEDSYESHSGPDAMMYVEDLKSILKLKPDQAQALYDVICAIVKSKASGGEITIALG